MLPAQVFNHQAPAGLLVRGFLITHNVKQHIDVKEALLIKPIEMKIVKDCRFCKEKRGSFYA